MLRFFYLFLTVIVTSQVNGKKWTAATPEDWRIWNAAKSNTWTSEGAPDVKEDELEELPSIACPGAPDIKCDGKTCVVTCINNPKKAARLSCNTYNVFVANGKFWTSCWKAPRKCWPICFSWME